MTLPLDLFDLPSTKDTTQPIETSLPVSQSLGSGNGMLVELFHDPLVHLKSVEQIAHIERCKHDFMYFFREIAWPVLEPGRFLKLNWHQELMAEHLQNFHMGNIRRLIINVAPRSLKSRMVSTAYPAWVWLTQPNHRFLCLSYAGSLANDHNDDRRTLIKSSQYQAICPMLISNTMDRITEFSNDSGGKSAARGLDGSVTGQGADTLLIDDPNNPEKAESEVTMASNLKKVKSYIATRMNDPKTGKILIIQQRTDESDISGYYLSVGGWTPLVLPSIAEDDERHVFPMTGRVVERSQGELLHAAQYDQEALDLIERDLGYLFAARHQQRPAPKEGAIIKTAWLSDRYYETPPTFQRIVQSWDTAQKAGAANAFWAGLTFGEWAGKSYLLDVIMEKFNQPDGEDRMAAWAWRWKPDVLIIEDKSTGSGALQRFERDGVIDPETGNKRWFNLYAAKPPKEQDKELRLRVETPYIQAKRLILPNAAGWLARVEPILAKYPKTSGKDLVDALSQYLKYTREFPPEMENEIRTGGRRSHHRLTSRFR